MPTAHSISPFIRGSQRLSRSPQFAVAADGKVYLGGAFTTYKGQARPYLVRLNEVVTEGNHAPTVIGLGPAETIVKHGESATLRVAATGCGSITYQWFRGGTNELFQVTAAPSLTLPGNDGDEGGFRDRGLFYTNLYYVPR